MRLLSQSIRRGNVPPCCTIFAAVNKYRDSGIPRQSYLGKDCLGLLYQTQRLCEILHRLADPFSSRRHTLALGRKSGKIPGLLNSFLRQNERRIFVGLLFQGKVHTM